jgi:site-specific DNA-methyltransferase (adenine-specific)
MKPYFQTNLGKLYHGDCMEIMQNLSESVDVVLTDPPYGIGISSWDVKIDIKTFVDICRQKMKPKSFFMFFGQMPTALTWIKEADRKFKFQEHICWVKRTSTSIHQPICRSHEDIFIYNLGKKKYCKTKGLYADVKVPGVMFDVATIQSVQRHISFLRRQIKTGKPPSTHSSCRNEEYKRYVFQSCPAPEFCNFTNVWSFLPDNMMSRKVHGAHKHPTVKPLLLLSRAVELLAADSELVLDPFLGSGTTAVACELLGRRWIGIELGEDYCEIAAKRIEEAAKENPLFESIAK